MPNAESFCIPLSQEAFLKAWATLDQVEQGGVGGPLAPLRLADVPIPRGRTPQEAVDVLLAGVPPAEERAVLRQEMMRWHPDKFQGKLGARLREEDRAAVLERVNAMQQAVAERYKGAKEKGQGAAGAG